MLTNRRLRISLSVHFYTYWILPQYMPIFHVIGGAESLDCYYEPVSQAVILGTLSTPVTLSSNNRYRIATHITIDGQGSISVYDLDALSSLTTNRGDTGFIGLETERICWGHDLIKPGNIAIERTQIYR